MKYTLVALMLSVGLASAMEPDGAGKARSSSVPSTGEQRTDAPHRARSSSFKIDLNKARQTPVSSPPAKRNDSPTTKARLDQVMGSPRQQIHAGLRETVKRRISSPELDIVPGE